MWIGRRLRSCGPAGRNLTGVQAVDEADFTGLKPNVAQRAPPTVEAEAGRIQPEPEARAAAPSVAVVDCYGWVRASL